MGCAWHAGCRTWVSSAINHVWLFLLELPELLPSFSMFPCKNQTNAARTARCSKRYSARSRRRPESVCSISPVLRHQRAEPSWKPWSSRGRRKGVGCSATRRSILLWQLSSMAAMRRERCLGWTVSGSRRLAAPRRVPFAPSSLPSGMAPRTCSTCNTGQGRRRPPPSTPTSGGS